MLSVLFVYFCRWRILFSKNQMTCKIKSLPKDNENPYCSHNHVFSFSPAIKEKEKKNEILPKNQDNMVLEMLKTVNDPPNPGQLHFF